MGRYIGTEGRGCQYPRCTETAEFRLQRNWGGSDFCYPHMLEVLHDDLTEAQDRMRRAERFPGWANAIATVNIGEDISTIKDLLREIPEEYRRVRRDAAKRLDDARRALGQAGAALGQT